MAVRGILRALSILVMVMASVATVQAEDLPTFHVTAKNGRLEPAQLRIPAGRRVKLQLHNAGPGPVEFESLPMHIEKVLTQGATSFVVLPALAPGRYEFVDEFHMETGRMQVIAE